MTEEENLVKNHYERMGGRKGHHPPNPSGRLNQGGGRVRGDLFHIAPVLWTGDSWDSTGLTPSARSPAFPVEISNIPVASPGQEPVQRSNGLTCNL